MKVTLQVHDETTSGQTLAHLELQLDTEHVTVRELIRARVHQEVRAHNAKAVTARDRFLGLVQPTETEQELNGYRLRRGRTIDADRQTDVALEAFERGRVLLLVDDRQVEGLDAELTLAPDTSVTFLKLVPLVGG